MIRRLLSYLAEFVVMACIVVAALIGPWAEDDDGEDIE